ncbi:MAG: HEAT repeat domain-containing protein [Myxococcota bacterium]
MMLAAAGFRPAAAHIVMGTKSLHLRVAEAELIVRGRVLEPRERFALDGGATRRSLVAVEVLEVIKGETAVPRLRFAQDGHAVAEYGKGDEALFFLRPIEKSRELRALAVPGGPTHVSGQEHDDAFVLAEPTRSVVLSATRAFAASERAEATDERIALIRGATLDLLVSRDDQLASAALSSLVMAPSAEWVTAEDLPRILERLADPSASVGFRAGLIDELERRGLLPGDAERRSMLEQAEGRQLSAAIRAVAMRQGPAVSEFLRGCLGEGAAVSPEVAAEAAMALGHSSDPKAVALLAGTLGSPEPRVRNAAIRGLSLLGSGEAAKVLREAAEKHPDPATQRRAKAALVMRQGKSAR